MSDDDEPVCRIDDRDDGPIHAPVEERRPRSTEVTAARGFVPDDYVPPKLGPLPTHIDLGDQSLGAEKRFLIATPFLTNARAGGRVSTTLRPVASGTVVGDLLQGAAASSFALDSKAFDYITPGQPPPAVWIRFHPTRPGRLAANVTVSVVGYDGSADSKNIVVTANVRDVINEPHAPKAPASLQDADHKSPPAGRSFEEAAGLARNEFEFIGDALKDGLVGGERAITDYQRKPPPKSELLPLIELFIGMGISGIAGVIAKAFAADIAAARRWEPDAIRAGATDDEGASLTTIGLPASTSSNEHLRNFVADSTKEGFKRIAKQSTSRSRPEIANADADNWQHTFFEKQEAALTEKKSQFGQLLIQMTEDLRSADRAGATAALNMLAKVLAAGGASAASVQKQATELAWVSHLAQHELGGSETTVSGLKVTTTNLDGARGFGEQGPMAVPAGSVPRFDGLLDIHVELGNPKLPVEDVLLQHAFRVKSASITGISQELANDLAQQLLGRAGIPLRLIVHGQDAVITRDEVGNVHVDGYLWTDDMWTAGRDAIRGMEWTEAHQHKAAKLLVDAVLSKTLHGWGVHINSDDATGTEPLR